MIVKILGDRFYGYSKKIDTQYNLQNLNFEIQ